MKESIVVHESQGIGGHFWVRDTGKPGKYEVCRSEITASVVCGWISYAGNPGYALSKAVEICDRKAGLAS